MTVSVTLPRVGGAPNVALPSTAIFQKDGKPAVWIVKADNTLELRAVSVERYDTNRVYVSDGIRTGERVVTAGVHRLAPGEKVKLLGREGVVSAVAAPQDHSGFNLSAWALTHKPLIGFLMVVALFAGFRAYNDLGRDEDPPFTIKVMVVRALWPGADAEQMAKQVTDRLEKPLESLQYLDFVSSYTQARRIHADGHAAGQHAAGSRARPVVPGAQEDRRHPRAIAAGRASARSSTTTSAMSTASSTR